MAVEQEYQVTPYRWLVLIFLMGCIFNNSMLTLTFSPISINVAEIYHVSLAWANMLAVASSLMFIPFNFLAIHLYKVWPRHYVLRVGVAI